MKKQIKLFLLIFLFPVFAINAQVQSFFIVPGQTIEAGNIIRGFCLERTKDELSDRNIMDLRHARGNVLVTFSDGRTEEMTFGDLYFNRKLLAIRGFESAQYVRMFLDDSVARVDVIDPEGVVLYRENMSDSDSALIWDNARLIAEMLRNGASHQTAQNAAWLNKKPTFHKDEHTKTITVDYHTSPVERQLTGRYGRTAAVLFDHYSGEYRFDGLRANSSAQTKAIYDFLTHFHSDHVDFRTLGRILNSDLVSSVYFPQPMLDSTMRKRSFTTMIEIASSGKYEFDILNSVCELLPVGTESNIPVINGFIGQFFFSSYKFGDITVDTYRHINPKKENSDGLIYRLQYKNVSQLILGDFDDEAALADLLRCSEENTRMRNEINEEIYLMRGQVYAGELSIDEYLIRYYGLQDRLQRHPVINADIVKWPHHAHVFSIELANELNRVINPNHFIYQVHSAQDLEAFKEFIDRTNFPEKFINSGEYDVIILSLLELINALRQG